MRTAVSIVFAAALCLIALIAPPPAGHAGARAEGETTAIDAAPVARTAPKTLTEHGRTRADDYDWLRNPDDPQVIAHLKAENAYADSRLAAIWPLIDEIRTELRSRETQDDATVPYFENGYLYERRFAQGAQFPTIVRRAAASQAAEGPEKEGSEEIVLDVAALAAGHPYYRLNRFAVSPDGTRVVFAVDFNGGRRHRLFMRTIATGEVSDLGIADAASGVVFSADGHDLFYVRLEPKTVRPYEVWRHRIGDDPETDTLVYAERDPRFELFVLPSKSGKFVLIVCDQENASEIRYLRADQSEAAVQVMEPRRAGVRYFANHVGDSFFVRTNLDAPDFRLMTAPEDNPGAAHWRELIPHRPGRFLWRFEPFEDYVAIDEEHEGAVATRVFRRSDMRETPIPLPAAVGGGVATTDFFWSGFGTNRDPSAHVLRLRFSAPLRPESVYDFDMRTGALTLRKAHGASRWFRADQYAAERIAATAPDGETIPITLVYRTDLRRPRGNPTLLLGYGAYGLSTRPTFNNFAYSLIDRGFVYALAHVRGGRERGERWYVAGRLLNKRNSFTDFIAAGEALIASGRADRRALFAQGRSAGGLLVAAAANLRPDLFAGVVAEVPFVDVLTTMSDPAAPLVTLEYDEWGNPADKTHYDYMRSYSPYDNIERKAYPAMFVTAGLHDSQVSYGEPAKWVARLRATRTDDRELLFKTDLGAGHRGRPGRVDALTEEAEIQAWLTAQARRALAR